MTSLELPPLFRVSASPHNSRERRDLQRRVATGELRRVRAGVFVDSADWKTLGERNRYLLTIRAQLPRLDASVVVSHESALVLHGVSYLERWPDTVHVTEPGSPRGHSRAGVSAHPGPLAADDLTVVDGLPVTTLARTCVDISAARSFAIGVAAVDECLRRKLMTLADARLAFDRRTSNRGREAARRVFRFAEGASGSAGESWCRCRMHEIGAPTPELQMEFRDAFGRIGFVDFWFPEFGVVVEFDGDQKYLDPRYRSGLSVEEVILRERKRERRLLAHPLVRHVVRVEWKDLVDPGASAACCLPPVSLCRDVLPA